MKTEQKYLERGLVAITLLVPLVTLAVSESWVSIVGSVWAISGWYAYWDTYFRNYKEVKE